MTSLHICPNRITVIKLLLKFENIKNEVCQDFCDVGLIHSDGKNWESQRKFTIKNLREFGFRKSHMENLITKEVKELICVFKEYQDKDKPLLIEDIFLLPVLNGLWILVAGEKLQQQDSRLKNLHHEYIALVYSLNLAIYCKTKLIATYFAIRAANNLQRTGVMFAPSLRHLAPSLLGWNRFVTANDAFNKFIEEKIADHINTYTDNRNRYI